MKRKRLLSVVLMFFVLISSFIMRMVDFSVFHHEIQLFGNYYEAALVGAEGFYCIKRFSLNEIYTMLLSIMMYVFGNGTTTVIILILTYLLVNECGNAYVAGSVSMTLSIILLFTDKLYEVSKFHLYVIGILLIIYVILTIAKKIYLRKNVNRVNVQNIDYFDSYDEINSVITLDDILGREVRSVETQTLIVSENMQEAPKGMTEIQIEDVERSKTQYIENPLPVPKRKEHKQMDYAIDTLKENDDFDITDMEGMDFFDIE